MAPTTRWPFHLFNNWLGVVCDKSNAACRWTQCFRRGTGETRDPRSWGRGKLCLTLHIVTSSRNDFQFRWAGMWAILIFIDGEEGVGGGGGEGLTIKLLSKKDSFWVETRVEANRGPSVCLTAGPLWSVTAKLLAATVIFAFSVFVWRQPLSWQ